MASIPVSERITSAQQALQSGKFSASLAICEEILLLDAKQTDALYLAAVNCRYLKNYPQARDFLSTLKSYAPEYGRAYQEMGHCLRELTQYGEAVEEYKAAVKRNPALISSWQQIATLSQQAAEQNTAQSNIDYLIALPKVLVSVISFMHENKAAKAESLCRRFLQANPKHVEGMRLLAKIGEQANVLDDAEFLLESCLLCEPDNHWARFDYINVLHRRQKFELAHRHACLLSEAMPNDASVKIALANQKSAIGDFTNALSLYNELERTEPENSLIPLLKGHVLKTMGEQQQAIDSYLKAIALDQQFGDAYWSLANLKTFRFTQQHIEAMHEALTLTGLSENDAIHLNFALAKALEDDQQYTASFDFYAQGNALKKAQSQYNAQQMQADFDKQKALFTPAFIHSKAGQGYQAQDPIFIVGLPRAGSTLLEQILSSHSQIDGTLELPNILSYVHELSGRQLKGQQGNYPESLAKLSAEQLKTYGKRYINETQIFRQGARYFIDKMPNNFRHIGLIKLILPNAKIIDARRDGMSCCFSAFKQLFAEGQEFSYDLQDLGEYYTGYLDLMDHWHQVFAKQILTVNYQDIVTDTEQQIHALFNYLALPVETNCFEFYNTQRAVRTASSEQVRQPIYQQGLAQWQNFQRFLSPLQTVLNQVDRQKFSES